MRFIFHRFRCLFPLLLFLCFWREYASLSSRIFSYFFYSIWKLMLVTEHPRESNWDELATWWKRWCGVGSASAQCTHKTYSNIIQSTQRETGFRKWAHPLVPRNQATKIYIFKSKKRYRPERKTFYSSSFFFWSSSWSWRLVSQFCRSVSSRVRCSLFKFILFFSRNGFVGGRTLQRRGDDMENSIQCAFVHTKRCDQ